jgi:hypothetical protein
MASKKILKVTDAPRVQALSAELEKYESLLPGLRERAQAAESALDAATRAADVAEVAVLAGRGRDADLSAAQARLADAKRERAIAVTALADAERFAGVLPAALEQARADALGPVAAALRDAYGAALVDFRDKLVAAFAAHEALQAASIAAHTEVSVFEPHPHYGALVLDAGEAGLLTTGAGLPPLAHFGMGRERVEHFVMEADRVLAMLPGMAEADRQRRPAMDNAHAAREAEERIKAANWAEHMRRDVQWIHVVAGKPYGD